jgi:hypothetical protein
MESKNIEWSAPNTHGNLPARFDIGAARAAGELLVQGSCPVDP